MSFVQALLFGDIRYEDELLNTKRTIFIDRLAPGAYILHVYFGHVRYRSLVNEHVLFTQLRRMQIPFSKGWNVYNVRV